MSRYSRIAKLGLALAVAVTLGAAGSMAWGLHLLDVASDRAEAGQVENAADKFDAAERRLDLARLALFPAEHTLGLLPMVGDSVSGVADLADAGAETAGGGAILSQIAIAADPGEDPDRTDRSAVAAHGRLSSAVQELTGTYPHALGWVNELRSDLLVIAASLEQRAASVAVFSGLISSPGRYLLILQNPAEMRGTGGLAGGFGVVTSSSGELELSRLSSDRALPPGGEPVDAPSGFSDRYDRFGPRSSWSTANSSPNFPVSAEILLGLFERDFGQRLDGVIAVDPLAMALALESIGPVRTQGVELDPDRFVDQALVDAYREANRRRARILLGGARAAWEAFESGADLGALIRSLGSAAAEKHIQFYSRSERIQARAALAGIDGELTPARTAGEDDVLMVAVQNARANKLDYYLRTELDYDVQIDDSGHGRATLSVRLSNDAPAADLPDYVTGGPQSGRPLGQARNWINLIAAPDAELSRFAGPEGRTAESGEEAGRPAFSWFQTTDPGTTSRSLIRLDLGQTVDRDGLYNLTLEPQAGLWPQKVRVTVNGLEIHDGPLLIKTSFKVDPGTG